MEDFVNFEIAKKLKEKGFDEACYNYYEPLKHCLSELKTQFTNKEGEYYGIITAPTISQVLKWLREKKGWIIVVRLYSTNGWYWFIQDKNGELKSSHLASCDDCFATYEQAAIAGIEYAIDNLI